MRDKEIIVEIPLELLISLTEGYRVLGFDTEIPDEIIKENEGGENDEK